MKSFPNLPAFDVVAIDVETTGLDWRVDRVFGVAISTPDGKDYYYDIRKDREVIPLLIDQVPRIPKIVNHHLKFDVHMLKREGVIVNCGFGRADCTMVLAALLDEHLLSYSLDALAKKYLGKSKDEGIYADLAELFGGRATRDAQMPNLHKAPPELVGRYAKIDSRLALELWQYQMGEVDRQGVREVVDFERRLFPYVVDMESHGIRVDVDRAEMVKDQLALKLSNIQKELDKAAGFPVNPNPSDSIHKLFEPKQDRDTGRWVANDGTTLETTGAGKASITAKVLERMKHPLAKMILQARKLDKTRSTFIEKHILERHHNGVVSPNINQTKGDDGGGGTEGTGTGRLSYTQPALQQIPNRDKEVARIVRPIFLPDEGQEWSYGDLDQHEFRIFIHYAKPKSMIDAYAANPDLDVHQAVADLTRLPRNPHTSGGANAKQMNLGMVFSMGPGKLAQEMGLPYTEKVLTIRGEERVILVPGPEAEVIIEEYHRSIPGVRETAKKASSVAKSRGYVKTLKGRHIRFPGGQYTHKAAGLVYQGSSADLNKENMMRISDVLKPAGGRLILNIHDEYSMSIPKMSQKDTKKLLKECQRVVQDRPELRVPIRIDFSKPCDNWWMATEAEKWT